MKRNRRFVLTLSCPDVKGIVHAVSGFLVESSCNILDSMQYGDTLTATFCMHVHFAPESVTSDLEALRAGFGTIAKRFGTSWELHDLAIRPRVMILVSKYDHYLNDLLYRHRKGSLAMDFPAVVSNHCDTHRLVAAHDIPFHHLPVAPEMKAALERALLGLTEACQVDVIVLARYKKGTRFLRQFLRSG